jgi:hypothetical protein
MVPSSVAPTASSEGRASFRTPFRAPPSLRGRKEAGAPTLKSDARVKPPVPALADRRSAIYAVAADGTDAVLAVDYGHYSVKGSIFAVRTILAPVTDAELARLGKN